MRNEKYTDYDYDYDEDYDKEGTYEDNWEDSGYHVSEGNEDPYSDYDPEYTDDEKDPDEADYTDPYDYSDEQEKADSENDYGNVDEKNFEDISIDDFAALEKKAMKDLGLDQEEEEEESDQEKKELLKLMERYRKGTLNDRQAVYEIIIKKLEKYIYFIMHKNYGSYTQKHKKDLFQEAICEIGAKLPEYDPNQAALTTFFKPLIYHALSTHITKYVHNSTPHYQNKYKEIRPVIKIYDNLGIEYTTRDLVLETGLSFDTVNTAIEDNDKTINGIEDPDYVDGELYRNDPDGYSVSPDKIVTKNEDGDVIYKFLSGFSELYRNIIGHTFGLNGSEKYGIPAYEELTQKEIMERYHCNSTDCNNAYKLLKNTARSDLKFSEQFSDRAIRDIRRTRKNIPVIPVKSGMIMMNNAYENDIIIEELDAMEVVNELF